MEMSEYQALVERICKNLMRIHKGDLHAAASELAELLIRPQPEIQDLLKKYVGESWIYEERWKNWEE